MTTGLDLYPRPDVGQLKKYVRLPVRTRTEKTECVLAEVEKSVVEVFGQADPLHPNQQKPPDWLLKLMVTNIGVVIDWPG